MKDKSKFNARNKRINIYKIYIAVVCLLTIFLNLLGCISGFCAFYKKHIYGYIASILGFVMSPIPVPVGELLMYLGAVMVLIFAVVVVLFAFCRKKSGYAHFAGKYVKIFFAVGCTVLLVYTTNWVIPYRAPHLDVKPEIDRQYGIEELQILRNYAVEQLNAVAQSIERDNSGNILLPENLRGDIAESMNGIADDFPQLKGYYPNAKASLCSPFLEWMRIGGYTYPYTMEVSYNRYNDDLYLPVLVSHEQSHHKGYYQENEATFLSIAACTHSKSKYLQYAGYFEFYYYIESDYVKSMLNVYEDKLAYEMIAEQPQLLDLVREDRQASLLKSKELYRKEVSQKLEDLFKGHAEQAGNVGWKAQGEIIGEATYGGCVEYLLEYYDGRLY